MMKSLTLVYLLILGLIVSCSESNCKTPDKVEVIGKNDLMIDGYQIIGDSNTIFNNFNLGDSVLYLNEKKHYYYNKHQHNLFFRKIDSVNFALTHLTFNSKRDTGVFFFKKELNELNEKGLKNVFPCASMIYNKRNSLKLTNGDSSWPFGGSHLSLSPSIYFINGDVDVIFLYQ